jgi:hypothetical protein
MALAASTERGVVARPARTLYQSPSLRCRIAHRMAMPSTTTRQMMIGM